MMALDLSSLKKALISLNNAIQVATADQMTKRSEKEQEVIKAGVIQNFEFTYELCWKFIQRWLRENRTAEEADYPRTRKELFRMAAREGIIPDPLPWFEYSDVRNMVAHTYNQENAEKVFQTAIKFMKDAEYLLRQLEERND
jgi:nucleotidyltransferase substrate binding protein (TIGR01987 family)